LENKKAFQLIFVMKMLDKIYKVLYFHLNYQYTDKHLDEIYLFFPANGMNKCIYTNLFAI